MQEILLYILGIAIVAVGIALSIGLHEVGHLLPAKLFKVKVTKFMIGFGKTVWSKKRGETEYGIKILPFGGFVSMIGMYPPENKGEKPREASTGLLDSFNNHKKQGSKNRDTGSHDSLENSANRSSETVIEQSQIADPQQSSVSEKSYGFSSLIADARAASAESIGKGENERAFYRLPAYKKIIIMLGGPLVNLLLGILFFAVLLSGIGIYGPSTTVGSVSECLKTTIAGNDSAQTACTSADESSPAAEAGLQPGDKIIAIAGHKADNWQTVQEHIAANPGTGFALTVMRAGTEIELQLSPQLTERAVYDDSGKARTTQNGEVITEKVGMVGLSPAMERQKLPLSAVPEYVLEQSVAVGKVILNLPARMVAVWQAAFTDAERDPQGPVSVVGVGRLAGEIASLDDTPVLDKVSAMVGLLAGLNIALFVFNLVPLLPLDGGHIAGAIYEALKRKISKLLGRGDPGPVDTAKMVPVTFFVVIILGAMSLLLIYADLVKPITLGG